MQQYNTRHLIQLALFTAIALILYVVEAQIPIPIPIPGIKLGLANAITLFILAQYGKRDALLVLLMRILLGSFFTGQLISFFYSLAGGLCAFLMMVLLQCFLQGRYLALVSVFGGIAHNLGQLGAAAVTMKTLTVFYWFPVLLLSGIAAGIFNGFAAQFLLRQMQRIRKNRTQ